MTKFLNATLALVFAALVAYVPAAAQDVPKKISGGILNGKATSLPKPAYPSAARAAGAQGSVNVQVVVDEEGSVESAVAVSGHPLLRDAAVDAARNAKFSPTRLSGQPVKVTGVVTYNFVTSPPAGAIKGDWFELGNMLAGLDHAPSLQFYQPEMIAALIPADWAEEQAQVRKLDELKKAEAPSSNVGPQTAPRVIREVAPDAATSRPGMTVMSTTIAPGQRISPEAQVIGQSLVSSVRGRLGGEPGSLWKFNLGANFNRALLDADSRDAGKREAGVRAFRESLQSPPPEVAPELLNELNNMADVMEKGIFTDADKIAFSELMTKVKMLERNR